MIRTGIFAASGGGGGPYFAEAVHFDGSTWLINAALVATDDTSWSSSGWYNLPGVSAFPVFYIADPEGIYGTNLFAQVTDTTVDECGLSSNNSGAVRADPKPETGVWVHILISVDDAGVKMYVNDVDVSSAIHVATSSFLSNGLPFWVGADSFPGDEFTGDMSDVWIAPGVSLLEAGDISEATRRLFISAEGKPVNPSGFPASAVLLSGDAATFATNQGSGGSFATTGTLTNASTSPSD